MDTRFVAYVVDGKLVQGRQSTRFANADHLRAIIEAETADERMLPIAIDEARMGLIGLDELQAAIAEAMSA
jgi:hypothetical protein